MIQLPPPKAHGALSVEEALRKRRSVREYTDQALSLAEVSQLLWAGYGITSRPEGFRTAPSARALYPLELYLAAGQVSGLPASVYRYVAETHALEPVRDGDVRQELAAATFGQAFVAHAAAIVSFAAVYDRTREAFGDDGKDYVHMDLGHAGENVHLQATALDLGTVVVAALRRDGVREALGLPEDQVPLYLMPIGHME